MKRAVNVATFRFRWSYQRCNSGLAESYMKLVSLNQLRYDKQQFSLIRKFQHLGQLMQESIASSTRSNNEVSDGTEMKSSRGVYVYGNVGTGKTMCMDMFFSSCNISSKRRVHFHKFMLEIHQRIHQFKQDLLKSHGRDVNINLSVERDAILQIARAVALETRLLCFDEFQVTDICDAMILSKLFNELWANGTVIVMTSNRPPQDLYKDGINREYFMPFINRLQTKSVVCHITTELDYRQDHIPIEQSYFSPLGPDATMRLQCTFASEILNTPKNRHAPTSPADMAEILSTCASKNVAVSVMMGRSIQVPFSGNIVSSDGVRLRGALLHFQQLCETDVGAADYKALCDHFDVIYVDGIPQLHVLRHDVARRFITLVDELYDSKICLIWASECAPNQLFKDLEEEKEGEEEAELEPKDTAQTSKLADTNSDHRMDNRHCSCDSSISTSTSTSMTTATSSDVHTLLDAHIRGENTVTHAIMKQYKSSESLQVLRGELCSIQELRFAFRRASSRLTEMAGAQYHAHARLHRAQLKSHNS